MTLGRKRNEMTPKLGLGPMSRVAGGVAEVLYILRGPTKTFTEWAGLLGPPPAAG
jgi:hypothetical protein